MIVKAFRLEEAFVDLIEWKQSIDERRTSENFRVKKSRSGGVRLFSEGMKPGVGAMARFF